MLVYYGLTTGFCGFYNYPRLLLNKSEILVHVALNLKYCGGKTCKLTNCLFNTYCFSVHKLISNSKCLQMVLGDVVRMVWPPQSPDLNPIEAMWDYIDSKLNRSVRTSQDKMWEMVQNVWNSIPDEILKKYIFSMKKRCKAVIHAKGGHTRY